ncbi:unnamed protein product, partial [Discosporangium mesarthrocarpum]
DDNLSFLPTEQWDLPESWSGQVQDGTSQEEHSRFLKASSKRTTRANAPAPLQSLHLYNEALQGSSSGNVVSMYYFEVTLVQAGGIEGPQVLYGPEGQSEVVLGFAHADGLRDKPCVSGHLPGEIPGSVGYSSKGRVAVHRTGDGVDTADDPDHTSTREAPPFGLGDTVGIGWEVPRGTICFTRNGTCVTKVEAAEVGLASTVRVYPVVGLHTFEETRLAANFGCRGGPFAYQGDGGGTRACNFNTISAFRAECMVNWLLRPLDNDSSAADDDDDEETPG